MERPLRSTTPTHCWLQHNYLFGRMQERPLQKYSVAASHRQTLYSEVVHLDVALLKVVHTPEP